MVQISGLQNKNLYFAGISEKKEKINNFVKPEVKADKIITKGDYLRQTLIELLTRGGYIKVKDGVITEFPSLLLKKILSGK